MSTHDVEETGMTDRQELLDFPGAEALQAAGRVEPPSAQTLARALEVVGTAAREDGRDIAVVTPLRPFRRRVVAVLAAAAVAAGVVVAYTNTGAAPTGTQHGAQASSSATVFLNDVAAVAATRPVGSGKYWKMHFKVGDEYISRSMEDYVVIDGKTSLKGRHPTWELGPKELDWQGLEGLSTNSGTLLKLLQSVTADADVSAFDQASFLLGGSPAGPELRAGLFQALAKLKGVEVVGTVKDATGRSGTELAFKEGRGTTQVIIDPKTSMLLEVIQRRGDGKVDRQTYLSVGLTDKLG
jgi:hypothetical protein